MLRDQTIREQAIAWAVRTGDPAFDAWDDFTLWLEQDPAHSAAYDAVAGGVADMAEILPAPEKAAGPAAIPAANENDPPPPRRWLGGAIAAALAVVMVAGVVNWRTGSYVVETEAGESRLVEIAGLGTVTLAGDSRLVLDRGNSRVAELARGQALFTLQGDDPGQPFTLTVGEDRLVDIGTIFDVRRQGDSLRVAVSEGAVLFNPEAERARVSPGQVLTTRAGTPGYAIEAIDPALVGEWSEGRLTFDDAPLADVAADLTRATGLRFVAAGGASRISGSILTGPVRDDPSSLAPLLNVSVRRDADGWLIGTP
jgi:transmembrane sensor